MFPPVRQGALYRGIGAGDRYDLAERGKETIFPMKLWEDMLDFVFPPHCPVCEAYVESRGDWCEDCLRKTLCVTRLPLSAGAMNFLDEAWALGRYHGGSVT